MTKVVIEMSGGCITDIHSDKDILVDLIDWDNIQAGDRVVDQDDILHVKGIGHVKLENLRKKIRQTSEKMNIVTPYRIA